MPTPKFIARIARLPALFSMLTAFPEGLPLRTLADRFDVDVETLRQDLITFMELQSWGWDHDVFRRPSIEFVQPESGYLTDGSGQTLVRLADPAAVGLGVEQLSAGDLALVYAAGLAQLDVDPDDTDLAEALVVIGETMYGEPATQPGPGSWVDRLRTLQQAQETHRRVRIEYSRAWHPGVSTRVIEPLRLLQTRRGWEVDAGPPDDHGVLRTFLLSNVRRAELLDETFEPPSHLESRLADQRRTTTVRMELVQDARWAADLYAESVSVVQEDEVTFTADLALLPPVGDRVALVMLAGGEDSRVLTTGVMGEATELFRALLEHHTQPSVGESSGQVRGS